MSWVVALLVVVMGAAGPVVAAAPLAGREAVAAVSVAEAPDTASALVAARRQGTPVLVADLTTETRLVRAKPDGAMVAELTTVPTRVNRGGAWTNVDTTLAKRPDGMVAPRTAVTELAFSGGG
ncbi:hypothetical protein OG394_04055 [Kribbella sp. NBC_01245]|uniref:hypothetical protein n=1 Tax=Kribbella sp. NBC_01245 TaxID=2903578 RepID=UPI002E2CF51C|nr:hypothetical protein [Kribbella sp. NBC_01245]